MSEQQCECTIENCDIFDFMSDHVGLTVLHPGGLDSTRKLAEACRLNGETRVIDIACGKGTGAIYLAQRYGCEVIGIDISKDSIAQATALARQKGLEDKVDFRVGDALDLPFSENEFDAAISQAMLVLVADASKAVREALRVIKPGSHLGWVELSWKKQPTDEFMDAVANVLCATCMQNVHTYQGWKHLLEEAGIEQVNTQPLDLGQTGFAAMLADEGLANTGQVIYKYATNPQIRKRMRTMNKFFAEHADYFGYGIYTGRK